MILKKGDQLYHAMMNTEKRDLCSDLEKSEDETAPGGFVREVAALLERNRAMKESIMREMVSQGIPQDVAERLLNLTREGVE